MRRSKSYCQQIKMLCSQEILRSQCDIAVVVQMEQAAIALSKNGIKANKMFGSAKDVTPMEGFQKYCHPNSVFRSAALLLSFKLLLHLRFAFSVCMVIYNSYTISLCFPSIPRKLWSCLVLLGLIFYTFSIPLSFLYLVENAPFSDTPLLLCIGYAFDLFFVVDAVLEFHFFMYFVEGLVVFDKNHIHQRYYQQRNCIREVIGLIPLDLATCFLGGKFCHHFRLSKLVRLPNFVMYMEAFDVMFSEIKIDIDLSLYRVIKLNILMIVVCHWVGCCWYMMASLSIELGYRQNWRYADENNESFSVSHSDFGGFSAYLRSIYWAIVGMTTVGEATFLYFMTNLSPNFQLL